MVLALRVFHLMSCLAVGLFAGLLYAFEQGVLPALAVLDGPDWVPLQQALIRHLDAFPTGVIVVANVGMLAPLVCLALAWRQRASGYWRLTALAWALFFFGVSLFTILLNVPINTAVLALDPAAPAEGWADLRDRWAMLNAIRTPVNYLAFALFVWAGFLVPGPRQGV